MFGSVVPVTLPMMAAYERISDRACAMIQAADDTSAASEDEGSTSTEG